MASRGAQLGPYRLLRPLRDAQVGSSFIAVRPGSKGFEKRVVIRCSDRAAANHVIGEAKRAASLCHSALAHVLDVGVVGEACFVVSEHNPGLSLRAHVVREGSLPWHAVARIVSEVADGLAYAHQRRRDDGTLLGVVHGRLCPRRITITHAGHAKLTGLGTSWAWPRHEGFAAPEERRGEPLDGRADVFGLGRTLQSCGEADAAPDAFRAISEHATHPWPERRPTALQLHEALLEVLADYSTSGAGSSVAGSASSAASGAAASVSAAAASSAS